MLDKFKKLLKKEKPVEVSTEKVTVKKSKKKPSKPRAKKENTEAVKKEKAKPEVKVVNVGFDPKNPRIGDLELEWNDEFIKLLSKHGYGGSSPEEKVDAWLNDICRTILANGQPMTGFDNLEGNRYISRTNLGDGKTEVK